MALATSRRKKKKVNPFVNYFKTFGLKQGSEIGLIIGSILMFIGFFVTQTVQVIGVFFALAAAAVGIARAILILLKSKKDNNKNAFKSALSLLIFWGIFFLIALLGIIFYYV